MKKFILLLSSILFATVMNVQAQQRMWGTTYRGGNVNNTGNGSYGTVFVYNTDNPNTQSIVYNYSSSTGALPEGPVTFLSDGHAYGTTASKGNNGNGTLWKYEIANPGYTVLHHFSNGTGKYPHGNLLQLSNGKAYGIASMGGTNDKGTLYELTLTPSVSLAVKHNFATATGNNPMATLIEVSPGILLGTTIEGGYNNAGVIFEYNLNTSTYTVKIHLDAATTGSKPWGKLVKAANGKYIGTTSAGGTNNLGTIYEYDYATNSLVVKQHMTTATGGAPKCHLLIASNGLMYGLAESGGANSKGTIFEYDYANNTISAKVDFDGSTKGASPNASLVENNGVLYGTTPYGGANNNGVIFKYDYMSNTYTKQYEWPSHLYGRGFPFNVTFALENCPDVTITTHPANKTVCSSGSTSFTVAATSTSTLAYKWQVKSGAGNFADITDDATYSGSATTTLTINSGTGLNGNFYRCKVTSGGCSSYTNSATLTVSTDPAVTPSVSIAVTDGSATTCSGSSVTFTATPAYGGSSPSYQWQVNNSNVGTGATYTSSSLSNGAVVHCIMTSNELCATSTTATSQDITMNVTQTVTPSVSIAITEGENGTCGSSTLEFTATATHGGSSPSYQWLVNNTNAGTGAVFSSSSLSNGDEVKCILTSDLTCVTSSTATSNTIGIVVNSAVTPTVSIAVFSGNATMCEGSSITFKATETYGGSAPAFQWKVNGNNVATGTSYTTSALEDGDEVTCQLTSNYNCLLVTTVTSNTITMNVTSQFTAAAFANGNASATICEGADAVLSATDLSGATYAWSGPGGFSANTREVTVSDAEDGDYTVTITLGSCSDEATTTIDVAAPPVAPSITPDFMNMTLTSSASTGNQWYLDGVAIQGATSQTINIGAAGDYTVTATSGGCTSAHSSPFTNFVSGISENTLAERISVYPNPSSGIFTIALDHASEYSVRILDVFGKEVYSEKLNSASENLNLGQLQKGIYFLNVANGEEKGVVKIIIE